MKRVTTDPGHVGHWRSPSLQELEITPPRCVARITLLVLLALVAGLCGWALVAQLDIVATAPGKLIPLSQVKLVQAPESGIVKEILVGEGDRVHADQVLMRLDSTLAVAEAEQVANELQLKRLVIRAIDAELADRAIVRARLDSPLLFEQVRALFAARRLALTDALEQERAAATRARHERLAAERQLDKLRSTLPVYQHAAESFARLLNEGFIGELVANEKQREAVEREQDLKAQEATIDALAAVLAQSERRQDQLRSNYRAELLRERGEAQAAVQRLEQEETKVGFRSRVLEVLAPQDGVVKDLVVRAAGQVVQAGSALLRVVPGGDPLVAEAMLANEDVGFVEVGQTARIKLITYPFQKYGMLDGRVTQISADAFDGSDGQRVTNANGPLTYRALLELGTQQLAAPGGRALDLAAGMAATIEIHQGRRTVMEFLLSPVQRVAAEAGRER
jgi:HlyD family secretion protein